MKELAKIALLPYESGMGKVQTSYTEKFDKIKGQTLLGQLDSETQNTIFELAQKHQFTLQELKVFAEWAIDTKNWQNKSLVDVWNAYESEATGDQPSIKARTWKNVENYTQVQKSNPRDYKNFNSEFGRPPQKIALKQNSSKIFGQCPVASEKTVCCNLYTIDPVKNCGFSCSYCSIQTMFKDQDIQFDPDFSSKVQALQFDPNKFYHVGSGQSSDALMWGNRNGILDDLCNLARRYPKILMEFKTKSKNISYFLETDAPKNIVCSWSLNPQTVIENEEHQTAHLTDRLASARKVADQGIKVSFHFHPMFLFDGWQEEYLQIFQEVQKQFSFEEIAFISFGTLTFPKPVVNTIRKYSYNTKILQMPFAPNPEGKLTYPLNVKAELFGHAYKAFSGWHDKVFFYLCMEEPKVWLDVFGRVYPSNKEFEKDFAEKVMHKIGVTLN